MGMLMIASGCCAAEPQPALWARIAARLGIAQVADAPQEDLGPREALRAKLAFSWRDCLALHGPSKMIVNDPEYFCRLLYSQDLDRDALSELMRMRVSVVGVDPMFPEYDLLCDDLVRDSMRESGLDGYSPHAAVAVSDKPNERKAELYAWLSEHGIPRTEKDNEFFSGSHTKAARP